MARTAASVVAARRDAKLIDGIPCYRLPDLRL
jgi:hypothetical protein